MNLLRLGGSWTLIVLVCSFPCQANAEDSEDVLTQGCGYASAAMTCRLLYSGDSEEIIAKIQLPNDTPVTLRDLKNALNELSFNATPFRVNDISGFSMLTESYAKHGPIAIVFVPPLNPTIGKNESDQPSHIDADGHYFVVVRLNGRLWSYDPVTFRRFELNEKAFFAQQGLGLLVSPKRGLNLDFLSTGSWFALLSACWLAVGTFFGRPNWSEVRGTHSGSLRHTRIIVLVAMLGLASYVLLNVNFQNLGFPNAATMAGKAVSPKPTSVQIEPRYEDGVFVAGAMKRFTFRIPNSSPTSMTISGVSGSCSCLELDCPDATIEPGQFYEGSGGVMPSNSSRLHQQIAGKISRDGVPVTRFVVHIKSDEVLTGHLRKSHFQLGELPLGFDEPIELSLLTVGGSRITGVRFVTERPEFMREPVLSPTNDGAELLLEFVPKVSRSNFSVKLECGVVEPNGRQSAAVVSLEGTVVPSVKVLPGSQILIGENLPCAQLWLRVADKSITPFRVESLIAGVKAEISKEDRFTNIEKGVVVYRIDLEIAAPAKLKTATYVAKVMTESNTEVASFSVLVQ